MTASPQRDPAQSPKYSDIVAAAQALFGEIGYEKTGIREIADRAHISLGTIYAYFPDGKSGVLSAALNERVERLVDYVAQTDKAEPLEMFLDRVRRLNTEIVRDPFLRRLFTDQGRVTEPRLRERGIEIVKTFSDLAVGELESLTAQGVADCRDPEAIEMLLRVANAGWIAAHHAGAPIVEHERLLDALLDSVAALIRVQPTARSRPARPSVH
ncbi:TetR/AcrR family transcriptional regulator [Mycolicibacterium wolinskyi]|uniref:TetR/AcrR family transcriptional regulator n=1 Tax=Mycolicibacterium wolinskyi TaxID=59750 RepID=UPI000834AFDF|nr:TetR/AcrR family transcriptional regulator [Mycolicibacterium wolinskyi]